MKLLLVFLLVAVISPFDGAVAKNSIAEDARECIRLKVLYSTKTTGVIEGYECRSCPPKVLYFNDKLVIKNAEGTSLAQQLKYIDGKAGVVFWQMGTTKALRVTLFRKYK